MVSSLSVITWHLVEEMEISESEAPFISLSSPEVTAEFALVSTSFESAVRIVTLDECDRADSTKALAS